MTDDTDTMIAKGIGKGLTELPQNVKLTKLNYLWLPHEVRSMLFCKTQSPLWDISCTPLFSIL